MNSLLEQALASGPYAFWLGMLLDSSLKSIVILLVATMAALTLRRASAAIRHMVWALALVSLLALPFFAVTLPPLPVSLPQAPAYSGRVAALVSDLSRPAGIAPERPVLGLGGAIVNMERTQYSMDIFADIPASVPIPAPINRISPLQTSHRLSWPAMVVYLWATGVALMLALLGVHTWRRQRLARASHLVQEGLWSSLFEDLAHKIQLKRSAVLLESEQASFPMTWGFLRPVVLVPLQARHWPASQRRDVLLHELAHIKRCDQLIQFLAQLACALYWFNPLVWLAIRRLWVEQEKACDDQVINAGVRPTEYGGLLMQVARSFRSPRGAGWVAVPMARSSRLAGRIRSILDEGCNRAPAQRKWWICAALVVALLVFPLAAASLKNGDDSAATQELAVDDKTLVLEERVEPAVDDKVLILEERVEPAVDDKVLILEERVEPVAEDKTLVLEERVEDGSKLSVESKVVVAANEANKTPSTPRNEPATGPSQNNAPVEQTAHPVNQEKQEKQEEQIKTYEEQLRAQEQLLRAQEQLLKL
jgi:beta-lactamase regulating signal transducer with metallopeptidase domain